jgi:hypothetical protein
MTNLDFNDAGEQRSFDVIPAGTICTLQMTVRPGGAGDGGWLRRSKDGASEALDAEFTVVDGPFTRRKLWQLFTLGGTTTGHAEAGAISRNTLRAILESARGIKPDDTSAAAHEARKVSSWNDFNGVRFVAQIGIRPPQGSYPAKNKLNEIITPDRQCWKQVEQIPTPTNGGVAPKTAVVTPVNAKPNAQPANAIARPEWAE